MWWLETAGIIEWLVILNYGFKQLPNTRSWESNSNLLKLILLVCRQENSFLIKKAAFLLVKLSKFEEPESESPASVTRL